MKKNLNISNIILFCGIALFPIYLLPSGSIQLTHLFLFLFALLSIVSNKIRIKISTWIVLFILLVLHVFIIESLYAINSHSHQNIINFFFLFFNLLIAISINQYVEKQGLNIIVYAVLTAATIALISATTSGINLTEFGEDGREIGSFNNPNQLGFFSACLLSFAYLFYYFKKINYLTTLIIFAIAVFLSILSLSKAAILANCITLFLALKPKAKKKWIIAWIITFILVLLIIIELYFLGYFDEYLFIQRLQNISQENDSSLESRGYFAFLNGNFIQLFFGMGSYNISIIVGHEVHSSIGSMINNYGFIGSFLFLSILYIWAYKIYKKMGFISAFCIVAPYFLYSITHNGTRFSFFWILFATSLAASDSFLKKNNIIQSKQ